MGSDDMLRWFDAADSRELATRLCEKYQVNGQTAWSLLQKAERFDIRVVTSLSGEAMSKMRLKEIEFSDLEPMMRTAGAIGYIVPNGAGLQIASG